MLRFIVSTIIALFTSIMLGTVGSVVYPDGLKLMEGLICNDGSELSTKNNSQSGQTNSKNLTISCIDKEGKIEIVTGKAMVVAVGVYFVLVFALAWIFTSWLKSKISSVTSIATGATIQSMNLKISASQQDEIRRLIKDGKVIEAIKLVRQYTNTGLKDSKDFIDAFRSGRSSTIEVVGPFTSGSSIISSDEDPVENLQKLKTMLDTKLISQEDYDRKKAEILSRM